jgi:5'-deoxynucleotidase YfbR-like HD superfamily hydrolase
MIETDTGNYTLTYTGQKFSFLDPEQDTIAITDIAWALAHTPRWGGHTLEPYSVAQHSITVAYLVGQDGGWEGPQMYALLHDASEAYIADIPSPVKRYLPEYRVMESKIQYAINHRFGVLDPTGLWSEMTERADVDAFRWEARDLMLNKAAGHIQPPSEDFPRLSPLCPEYAYEAFMETFGELEAALV